MSARSGACPPSSAVRGEPSNHAVGSTQSGTLEQALAPKPTARTAARRGSIFIIGRTPQCRTDPYTVEATLFQAGRLLNYMKSRNKWLGGAAQRIVAALATRGQSILTFVRIR